MFKISKLFKKKLIKTNKKHMFILTTLILIIISNFFRIKHPLSIFKSLSHILTNTHNICTHQSNEIIIEIHSTIEKSKFKLTSPHIQYFSHQKTIQCTQPYIIIFDSTNTAIWKITSNQAILNYEKKILYLYGYIYINKLLTNTYSHSIITNHAIINLNTKDIMSKKIVIIHGNYFYSIGMHMNGNLNTKTIELTNTHTHYDIKK